VLWSLLNVLPGKTTQPPHRHNSVALDLCISAPGGGRVYTAMSKTMLADGSLLEPVTVSWESGSAFVTPPGWWHSHINEAEGDAWVLPLQDAGLVTHQRILDIRFAPDEMQQHKEGRLTGTSLNYHVARVGAGAN
jgi:gentisate 1,2-dioxygenase